MIWSRLKSMQCPNPKCRGIPLKVSGEYYVCTRVGCPFSISKPKFNEVVEGLYDRRKRKIDSVITLDENLSMLNDMGRTIMTEGFLE